ncbi:hypothetical protein GCM10007105_16100 [Shewanella chilikensis]|nr:hypothetical protein GCM10007105_16100 [Shewanella chilikensis]
MRLRGRYGFTLVKQFFEAMALPGGEGDSVCVFGEFVTQKNLSGFDAPGGFAP